MIVRKLKIFGDEGFGNELIEYCIEGSIYQS